MSARRILAGFLALILMVSGPGFGWAQAPPPAPATPPAPAAPPAPGGGPVAAEGTEATPPRVSYINGEVSFWRPGAQDWTPATLNMPLAPGDLLYAGAAGNVEIQVGPRAFVRAAYGTQVGLDNQEPDFVQLRVTAGHAALDVRELAAGHTVELDTPNAAFTIERTGYYHVDVAQDSTTFRVHRGGRATMTPAGGAAALVAANQQVVVTGTDSPRIEAGAASALTAWDRWNYQRSDYLTQPASARYVSPGVYGAEALDQHGSWRTVETYGAVWVPAAVPVGWVPYSTGRWIWDPRFGWTWLDDLPWGWAPYHYGRWVFVGSYWAWAPGPIIVRAVYAPALVVFLGGGVTVSFGRPFCWAPLGWGEPVIRWWGHPRFVGVAWWGGWGGPRVVNNVVINRTTTVNVTNITVYRNVHVTNAVVGVPADRFGQGVVRPARLSQADVRQLAPVRGAPDVRPVAASVMPAAGPGVKPPEAIRGRAVVATRAPHDSSPALREHGLATTPAATPAPAPRLVTPPKRVAPPAAATGAPGAGPGRGPSATPGPAGPGAPPSQGKDDRPAASVERGQQRQAAPPAPARPAEEGTPSRRTPPPAPPSAATHNDPSPHGRQDVRSEPRGGRAAPQAPGVERPPRGEPSTRGERPERGGPPPRGERPERGDPR